jgi:hypothetical protein
MMHKDSVAQYYIGQKAAAKTTDHYLVPFGNAGSGFRKGTGNSTHRISAIKQQHRLTLLVSLHSGDGTSDFQRLIEIGGIRF